MVAGSRCQLASGLPLSAQSRQHRLCRIKCCTWREDGVPSPARFRLCRRPPGLRWQSRLRRQARAPGWRHNWNCRPGLSEWRKLTCSTFSGFPTNFGSLSHQLSPSCGEPSLMCTAQLTGIGGSSFLSRKCASSSVLIFVYTIYTGESNQSIALEASAFMFLKCWLALSSGASTGPQPTAIQHVVTTVMVITKMITDTYTVMLKTFWGIASPNDQHKWQSIGSLPVQKHKN